MASAADEEPTSGDFTVLETTRHGALDLPCQSQGQGQGLFSEEELASKCEEAILKLCSVCGSEDDEKNQQQQRPFRIVIIGKHGAGKSSFVNGVAAALSEDCWHEYAVTGDLGKGVPVTISNQRLVKCANEKRERYKKVQLPTIIDVAGLSDEMDTKVEELLRLLFYGHIEEDEPLMTVYLNIKEKSTEEIRNLYGQSYPEMRVDRVIFVASAMDDDPLPLRLMSMVHNAARPSHTRTERRAVPIYGILTKKDKTDLSSTAFLDKKRDFMRGLGLNNSRFLLCSNYCDDVDMGTRTERLRPDLDLPILRFMQLVCDRALRVVREDEVLPGSDNGTRKGKQQQGAEGGKERESVGRALVTLWRSIDPLLRDALTSTVVGLLAMAAFMLLLPSTGQGDPAVSEACRAGAIRDEGYRKLLCGEKNTSWAQFQQRAGQMVVAVLITAIVFLYRHTNRRL
ncbi:uncharacterized protein LOC143276106 [Babylonia areolata]|uniref:uncharacterized protein LOC143276106 n=1 Tax=Babylonia areolata TaxID=304850 RepID=UPI003FD2496A